MAWVVVCYRCGYRIISKRKREALKFYDIHVAKSHPLYPEEEVPPMIYRVPDEDYEVIKSIPKFPALVI